MGKALYRTYRSKKLSEIVGQEHITVALTNALKSGALSHAYLFTGPRGVGKTSIARILAHEINQLPYADDSTHLDIIEIDAASNRRIDEIRSLRDKVHIAPSNAKYKVYIIDEVHMLTREAFNALLKTLEEPPAHAVFILATTEVHKLPETIISRTQRFTFKPVDIPKVVAHLGHIAKKEKLSTDEAALQLIAEYGEGSFRDSISLLDQARSFGKKVTRADIEAMLGIAPIELIAQLTQNIYTHDAAQASQTLHTLFDQGSDASQVAKQLSGVLRQHIIENKASLPQPALFALLNKLVEVPASSDPKVFLEITVLDAAFSSAAVPASPITATPPANTQAPAATPKVARAVPTQPTPLAQASAKPEPVTAPEPAEQKPAEPTAKTRTEPPTKEPEPDAAQGAEATPQPAPASTGDAAFDAALWPQLLSAMKKYNTLHSILKSATPYFSDHTITLEFAFAFHQKRINESKNKQIVAEIAKGLCGEDITITCVVSEGKPKPIAPVDGEVSHTVKATGASDAPTNAHAGDETFEEDYYIRQAEEEAASRPITAINNIFGGGELLES